MQGWFSIYKLININRIKDKNHMILSIDAEKALNKIQHFFMLKTLKKLGIEGMYLKIIEAIYDKPIANITLNGEKQIISSKVRNETRVSTLPTLIQCSTGIFSQSNKAEKKIKEIQIGNE
jgi:hypothetical protein